MPAAKGLPLDGGLTAATVAVAESAAAAAGCWEAVGQFPAVTLPADPPVGRGSPATAMPASRVPSPAAPADHRGVSASSAPTPPLRDPARPASPVVTPPMGGESMAGLKRGARVMLSTLVRVAPRRLTKPQLGLLCDLKQDTLGVYLSALRSRGLAEVSNGDVWATDAGIAAVGAVDPLTVDDLLDLWRSRLKAGARRMFDAVVDAYPAGVPVSEMGVLAGSDNPGTVKVYLGTLTSKGLAVVDGDEVYAVADLFAVG